MIVGIFIKIDGVASQPGESLLNRKLVSGSVNRVGCASWILISFFLD
ncbi:hypothetical protein [Leptospira sp. Pond_2020]|nr:hypothetical protein [Leptospira sp. Pond_2020]MCD1182259.1 hypothetical protein [Leptospira sp. Pond_2020]